MVPTAGAEKDGAIIKRSNKVFTKKNSKPLIYGLVLAASLGIGIARAGADDEEENSTSTLTLEGYCHQTFPAIRPETLGTDHPQLQDPSSGGMIDFYGPCDHNPLSKDEVDHQEHDQLVRRLKNWAEF